MTHEFSCFLQKYEALKTGEMWLAVSERLQKRGVEPVVADKALLESAAKAHEEAVLGCKLKQRELRALFVEATHFLDGVRTQYFFRFETEAVARERQAYLASLRA